MLATLLLSALCTVMALLLAFPQTPAVRALHRLVVEAPARFPLEMTWRGARTYALVVPIVVLLLLLGPELVTAFLMAGGDVAAIELLLVVWGLTVSGAAAGLWRKSSRIAVRILHPRRWRDRVRGQMRARRPRRKTSQKGRKDDGPAPGWVLG